MKSWKPISTKTVLPLPVDEWQPGPRISMMLVATVVFGVYANTLAHGFVYDDIQGIINNPLVSQFKNLAQIPQFLSQRWRSLTQLSFALTHYFFGFEPWAYHLGNVLIHAANSLLVLGIAGIAARRWLMPDRARMFALTAALIHAAHPVYSEAVAYTWGRSSSLCALFYLGSLFSAMKGTAETGAKKYLWYACMALSGILAWHTKEEAITLPLVIAGFFALQGSLRSAGFIALTPLIVVLSRWKDIGGLYVQVSENVQLAAAGAGSTLNPWVYFLTHIKASVFYYLSLLIFPWHQNADPEIKSVIRVSDPFFVVSVIVLLLLALLGLAAIRNNRVVSFGILALLVSPLTAYALMPLADVVAEHRIYISGLGFDLLAAWALIVCFRHARLTVALVTLVLGVATISRNTVWADSMTLWRDVERKSPGLVRPHLNLGFACQSGGRLDEALVEYKHALSISENLAPAYINMALIYLSKDELALSEAMLRKAIALAPGIAAAYINLATVMMRSNRHAEALQLLDRAERLEDSYIVHLNKGDVLARMGQNEAAGLEYRRALIPDPGLPQLKTQIEERIKRLAGR